MSQPSLFPTPASRCAHAARATGFTLIELMISIVISMVVLIALVSLLVSTNRNNGELARTNSQIENGRFAIQLLQGDVAQAGFWGAYVPSFDDLSAAGAPTDAPDAVPAPCLAYSAANWDAAYKKNLMGIPVQGYDAAPSGCSSVVASKKADTDVLVVRHAEGCVPGAANCDADTTGRLYFQASLCESDITGGTPYVLDTTGFTLQIKGCTGTLAEKRRFISNIYYIRDYATTAGDGIPTLVRSQFDLAGTSLAHQTAVPLIEGIEHLKVEYGIDDKTRCNTSVDYTTAITRINPSSCAIDADTSKNTLPTNRGDGIPDGAYVRCTTAAPCTAAQLSNAVSVKIYVLARSKETTPGYTDSKTYALGTSTVGPFNDSYKRHVFSTTVRLVNVAGRRETP
ncbi:pilus assembly protein PilW [Oxalobacteraceae bacterium OM1]|nr:pilus assembly protein PilW [Oxalobacteraceae bacterium OM1]